MTFRDLDEPRMIYTGPLPPHLARADAQVQDDESFGEALPAHGQRSWLAFAATAAVALVTGVAIGAIVTPWLRADTITAPKAVVADSRPPAVAAPPTPASVTQPETLPAAPATNPVAELQPPAPAPVTLAPRAALAMLTPAAKPAPPVLPANKTHAANTCAGSRADRAVCADPIIAAADHDLKQAYQHAIAAGAPAAQLREEQIDWLLAREDAARRSPADLALAYRQRIDQLNNLADEPPH